MVCYSYDVLLNWCVLRVLRLGVWVCAMGLMWFNSLRGFWDLGLMWLGAGDLFAGLRCCGVCFKNLVVRLHRFVVYVVV